MHSRVCSTNSENSIFYLFTIICRIDPNRTQILCGRLLGSLAGDGTHGFTHTDDSVPTVRLSIFDSGVFLIFVQNYSGLVCDTR